MQPRIHNNFTGPYAGVVNLQAELNVTDYGNSELES
jgi:hypothetical protein